MQNTEPGFPCAVSCYMDKSSTSAFPLHLFGPLTLSRAEFNQQQFPVIFDVSQLRLKTALFRFLTGFQQNTFDSV